MMPPGHIALTWVISSLWPKKKLDYRGLAICAMLPDFLDKPMAWFIFTEAKTSQFISHALIPHTLLLIITLFKYPRALPYVLAFNGHLIADRMWKHTQGFWWPLYGWTTFWEHRSLNSPEKMMVFYLEILRYPKVWVVELIAIVFLVWFIMKHRLYEPKYLAQFIKTGQVCASSQARPKEKN